MPEPTPTYDNITITKRENSKIEIEGEIRTEAVARIRSDILKKKAQNTTVPGFRTGHVPENVLVRHIGEPKILEETAERALSQVYPAIVAEHNLDVIGHPQITITKLALGNPIGFKITAAILPEITMPDYKKIAKEIMENKEEPVEVTEKEVEDFVTTLRKNYQQQRSAETAHSKDLPPLTDEFVKTLGDFKNVTDFRQKIKNGMYADKKRHAKEKRRAELTGKIAEQAHIALPEILIESELTKMVGQFKSDIARMNLTVEDYLKKIKKTEEDLKKEWRADAEKRAKLQLVLNKITEQEHITVSQDEIEKHTKHLLEHHRDADPARARIYIETILTNEKVIDFLEEQK